jgi:hypothetical protein
MKNILCCILSVLFLAACSKNKVPVPVPEPNHELEIRVIPFFNSDSLCLDSTYFLNNGTGLQFTDIKFYCSEMGNGSTIWTNVALFDYRSTGTLLVKNVGQISAMNQFQAGIGVPSNFNNSDPNLFPATSPLNILNANDMHWGWNPGYVFIKLEGKADTIADGIANFDLNFTYHIGTNAYYFPVNVPDLNWEPVSNYLQRTRLKLAVQAIFDHPTQPIHLNSEYTTHSGVSEGTLTEKVTQNFIQAISAL